MKSIQLLLYFSVISGALCLSSCHKADPPVENDDCLWDLSVRHKVVVSLENNTRMDFFEDVRLDDDDPLMGPSARNTEEKVWRYTVKAFRHGSTQEIACASGFSPEFEMDLPVGKVDIIAWADYVSPGITKDEYFFTDDFSEILVFSKYPYYANDRFKFGCWGKKSLVLAYNTPVVTVSLSPAMGQLKIIATDEPRDDVSRIRISYPGRIPSAINGFSGNVCYSWADVGYESYASVDDNGQILLGFDNIFADYTPCTVPIRIEMTRDDGHAVARRLRVEAPVKRGCITEVRGKFYSILEEDPDPDTPDSGGGIIIDPDLDETIIIELN